jgi:hypothetical protein
MLALALTRRRGTDLNHARVDAFDERGAVDEHVYLPLRAVAAAVGLPSPGPREREARSRARVEGRLRAARREGRGPGRRECERV